MIKRILKRVLYLILPVVIGFPTYTGLVAIPTATAQNTDWVTAELYPIVTPGVDLSKFDQNNFCSSPKVEVGGNMVQACGHNTKVPYSEITLPEDNDSGTLLGVNIDGAWQPVRTGFDRAYSVGNTGDLIGRRSNSGAREVLYYKNFMSRLVPADSIDGVEKYKLYGAPDFTLKLSGIDKVNVVAIATSQNSEWLAMYVSNVGVLRMNTETLKTELVSPKIDPEYSMTAHHLAISNSGKYIVDNNMAPTIGRVYKLEPSCVREVDEHTDLSQFTIPCAYQILPSSQPSSSGPGLYYTYTYFTPDDSEIYSYSVHGNTINVREYIPQPPEPTPEPEVEHKLDYLALGDSYTSGEGDIRQGPIFYRAGTNDAKGCHLSSRSYPFLLRDYYGIDNDKMASVACSGARVSADYIGDNKDYLGQTTTMQAAAKLNPDLKQSALDNFTPGYNKQLEFVKKYQPKLITVMGGGNDVGFSDVLRYCASPNLIDNTCSYTIEGTKLHKMLQDSIITQYFINKRLISDIKKYSPTSRIAIIGYPSFIATDTLTLDNFRFCGIDGGLLNQRERKMINGRLHDFNVMLKQLAHDMYVSFVDLEKSLNGGRICEGNAYMNDIWDTGGPTKAGNNPATFHPNDLGHRKMQEAIIASDVFNHKAVPDSQGINYEEKMRKRTEQASIAEIAGSTFRIITNAIFNPLSLVQITMFSDTIDLGVHQVDSGGKLKIDIPTTDLPTGQHVLLLEGTDPDGQEVQYYQFIEIKGSDFYEQKNQPIKTLGTLNKIDSALYGNDVDVIAARNSKVAYTHDDTNAQEVAIKEPTDNNTDIKYIIYLTLALFTVIISLLYAKTKTNKKK